MSVTVVRNAGRIRLFAAVRGCAALMCAGATAAGSKATSREWRAGNLWAIALISKAQWTDRS